MKVQISFCNDDGKGGEFWVVEESGTTHHLHHAGESTTVLLEVGNGVLIQATGPGDVPDVVEESARPETNLPADPPADHLTQGVAQ